LGIRGWELVEALFPNAPLELVHPSSVGWRSILETIQVEQSMHGVKGYFGFYGMFVFRGATPRGFRADHDFAVVEGDHVGGARDVHELAMHPRDDAIGDERDFDLFEPAQHIAAVGAMVTCRGKRERGEAPQPREIQTNGSLPIADFDAQRRFVVDRRT
jgi:hypothetical protein